MEPTPAPLPPSPSSTVPAAGTRANDGTPSSPGGAESKSEHSGWYGEAAHSQSYESAEYHYPQSAVDIQNRRQRRRRHSVAAVRVQAPQMEAHGHFAGSSESSSHGGAVPSSTGSGSRNRHEMFPSQRTRVSQLPHGWVQYWCPIHKDYYYFHPGTNHSTWQKPAQVSQSELPMEAAFRRKRFRLLCAIGSWNVVREDTTDLHLNRDHMIFDSVAAIMRLSGEQLKLRLKIIYSGESGIDSGGLTKDWYLELSRGIMSRSSQLGMFVQSEHSGLFSIDPRSHVAVEDYERMFRFVGRLLGKAIFDRHVLDVPLCSFLFKRLLKRQPELSDIEEMDKVYCTSLRWMLENNIEEAGLEETFSVLRDEFGSLTEIDLCPDGRNIAVTEENKHSYVQALVDYVTGASISKQLNAMMRGFHEIVPARELKAFSWKELKALVNGKDTIDAKELQQGVKYTGGLVESSPLVSRFWAAFETMGSVDRQDFLRFVTGTCRIPLDGFDPPFTITPSELDGSALPMSHTCL